MAQQLASKEELHQYLDPHVLEKIKRLDLRARHVVEGFISGLHRSPFQGFSVEFATHREYVPGDDIKHIDSGHHRTHTGVPNQRILENLQRLGQSGTPIEIRMPVIPTVNDDGQDIEATALLLAGIQGITRIELLPYHKLGASKYARLGMPYQLDGLEPPSAPEMEAIAQRMRAHGLEVHVGS